MKNILFVCTGNSARSIIAESIINNEYSNKFNAFSAGSNPSGKINEDVKNFLEKNKSYDLTNYSSKNFEEFINKEIKMDHVITVCNNANNEVCPIWPDKNPILSKKDLGLVTLEDFKTPFRSQKFLKVS